MKMVELWRSEADVKSAGAVANHLKKTLPNILLLAGLPTEILIQA